MAVISNGQTGRVRTARVLLTKARNPAPCDKDGCVRIRVDSPESGPQSKGFPIFINLTTVEACQLCDDLKVEIKRLQES
jgi:hypothetical protein